MKGIYWSWAENLLECEPNREYYDPHTGNVDLNQDTVFNVNIGMTNLEYLGLQDKMGKLLANKKKLDKKKKGRLSIATKDKLNSEISKT